MPRLRGMRKERAAKPPSLYLYLLYLNLEPFYVGDMMYNMIAKVIQCGEVYEVVLYERPVPVGYHVERKPREKDENEEKTERRLDNLARARKNVRQLILTNQTHHTKFVTLTYANTMLEYDQIVHDFKMFMKNMKRYGFDNLPYLYVIEHQKERGKKEGNEGSLHIHAVFFTSKFLPYEVLKRAWGKRGSVDVKAIDNIRNLGAYVSKYITKEGQIAENKPMYHVSRGLTRPTEKCLYDDGGHDQGLQAHMSVKELLSGIEIYYQDETQFTYTMDDEEITQRVKYFQGRRRRCKKS